MVAPFRPWLQFGAIYRIDERVREGIGHAVGSPGANYAFSAAADCRKYVDAVPGRAMMRRRRAR